MVIAIREEREMFAVCSGIEEELYRTMRTPRAQLAIIITLPWPGSGLYLPSRELWHQVFNVIMRSIRRFVLVLLASETTAFSVAWDVQTLSQALLAFDGPDMNNFNKRTKATKEMVENIGGLKCHHEMFGRMSRIVISTE